MLSAVTPSLTTSKVSHQHSPFYFQDHSIIGFSSKFYALLSTRLTDVVFMDADNLASRSLHEIFESEAYRQTGAIIWPDYTGEMCRIHEPNLHLGDSAYSTFVLFVAKFANLSWTNTREYAQESETGVFHL